ncbi:MAG: terminase small subunit [Smithella sp.]
MRERRQIMTAKKELSTVDGDNPLLAKLTDKQRRFCDEYLLDLNQMAAYVRAGYSPLRADSNAARLMENECIRAYIDQQLALQSRRTGVTAARVIRELARIAFANPAKVVAEDGSILDTATEDDLAAISSIKIKTTYSKSGPTVEREVRFTDKNKSLELLMRHAGMLIDKKQVDITSRVEGMSEEEIDKHLAELDRKVAESTIDVPVLNDEPEGDDEG